MIRIDDALAQAVRVLENTSATADLDARVLLEHSLSRTHAWLLAHGNETIHRDELERYRALIEDRRRGEPVAYITGWKEFWSLRLEVACSVLVPRPETEHLVEHALRLIPEHARYRVADLGTGSGAVALAIARERPACELTATDISIEALRVADNNARRLEIQNIRFLCGHWYAPLAGRDFDVIVSNPPYIADDDACLLHDDLAYEPVSALKAGPEGLDALHDIGTGASRHLRSGGWILVEHGFSQRQAVRRIFERGGLHRIVCNQDHSGHPRITVGQMPVHIDRPA